MEDVINNSLSEVYTDVLYQDNSIELSEDEKINKIEFHFEQIIVWI